MTFCATRSLIPHAATRFLTSETYSEAHWAFLCAYMEALDHTMTRLERGEITAVEAIDLLLSEEFSTRETRRIDVALKTARLAPIKTIESFDFSFQPSLDRGRILALAQLEFVARNEVVHFLSLIHI